MVKVILISLGIAYGIPFAISFFVDNDSRRMFRRIATLVALALLLFFSRSIAENWGNSADRLLDGEDASLVEDYVEAEEEVQLKSEIDILPRGEFDIELGEGLPIESVEASSVLYAKNGYPYGPELTIDGDLNSCWQEGAEGNGEGEYIKYVLGSTYDLQYITIVNGQAKSEKKYYENGRIARLELRFANNQDDESAVNGGYYVEIPDEPGEYVLSLVDVVNTSEVNTVYVYINEAYQGSKWSDTCVSEVCFY